MKRLILMILIGISCIVMATSVIDIIRGEPDVINEYTSIGTGIFVIAFALYLLRKHPKE